MLKHRGIDSISNIISRMTLLFQHNSLVRAVPLFTFDRFISFTTSFSEMQIPSCNIFSKITSAPQTRGLLSNLFWQVFPNSKPELKMENTRTLYWSFLQLSTSFIQWISKRLSNLFQDQDNCQRFIKLNAYHCLNSSTRLRQSLVCYI